MYNRLMLFGKIRKWMAGHTSVKIETFIKKEYREPDNETKNFFKRYGLGEPSPVKKRYCVRVYDKEHLIDEEEFCDAIDAQNYIQNTKSFYSNLIVHNPIN